MIVASWLNLLCRMLPKVSKGVFVRHHTDGSLPLTRWPNTHIDTDELLAAAKLAAKGGTPLFHHGNGASNAKPGNGKTATDEPSSPGLVAAHPVFIAGHLYGVVAIEATISQAQQAAVKQLLQWGEAWLQLLLREDGEPTATAPVTSRAVCSESLTACLLAPNYAAGLQALVTGLTQEFQCQRVAAGSVKQGDVSLQAVSNRIRFDRRTDSMRLLEVAMIEALGSGKKLFVPTPASSPALSSSAVSMSHQQTATPQNELERCCLVLAHEGVASSVLLLERAADHAFSAVEIHQLEQLSVLLGPLLAMQQAQQRSLLSHAKKTIISKLSPAANMPGRGRRYALLTVLVIGLVFLTMPGQYRVSATAELEGKVQRAVVAPFDGYVKEAHRRAGERVNNGEIIAVLDSRELALEQQRLSSQRNEQNNQYRQSLAAYDNANSRIHQAQIAQTDAQLQLLDNQLQRTQLASPLEGIIIAGDLSRSLGAPVQRGQVLFEIAPLNEYRLVLLVNESDVADIAVGQQGLLTLTALPDQQLPFVVERIATVFEEAGGQVKYRTEARIKADPQMLRPGMQGIGKISIDQRSRFWILFHDMIDWLKLKVWLWTP